jgi:hypothetical protein
MGKKRRRKDFIIGVCNCVSLLKKRDKIMNEEYLSESLRKIAKGAGIDFTGAFFLLFPSAFCGYRRFDNGLDRYL